MTAFTFQYFFFKEASSENFLWLSEKKKNLLINSLKKDFIQLRENSYCV